MSTLVQQIWHKLDESIAEAFAWKGDGSTKPPPDASDLEVLTDWLQDRVNYLEGPAGRGRGLAEALVVLCTPAFTDVDAVVKLAVTRWQATQNAESMPATPGFMGAGVSGNSLRLAGQGQHQNAQSQYRK